MFRDHFHEFGASAIRTNREAAAERLAVRDEIGRHAVKFLRSAEREAKARDDLVENERDAKAFGGIAQTLQKSWQRREAAVEWFNDHCRQFASVRGNNFRRRRQIVEGSDQNILFHMRDGTIYRNTLRKECPSLRKENRFSYPVEALRPLCSGNLIAVLVDYGFGDLDMGLTCPLGVFVPVSEGVANEMIATATAARGKKGGGRRDAVTATPVEVPTETKAPPQSAGETPAVPAPEAER